LVRGEIFKRQRGCAVKIDVKPKQRVAKPGDGTLPRLALHIGLPREPGFGDDDVDFAAQAPVAAAAKTAKNVSLPGRGKTGLRRRSVTKDPFYVPSLTSPAALSPTGSP